MVSDFDGSLRKTAMVQVGKPRYLFRASNTFGFPKLSLILTYFHIFENWIRFSYLEWQTEWSGHVRPDVEHNGLHFYIDVHNFSISDAPPVHNTRSAESAQSSFPEATISSSRWPWWQCDPCVSHTHMVPLLFLFHSSCQSKSLVSEWHILPFDRIRSLPVAPHFHSADNFQWPYYSEKLRRSQFNEQIFDNCYQSTSLLAVIDW